MQRYNILLEVSDDLDVTDSEMVSPGVQWEISQLGAFWPRLITPGTQIADPKKLMHAVISTDIADVGTLIQSLIIGYELDWTILGLKTWGATEPITEWSEELQEDVVTGYKGKFLVPLDEVAIVPYLSPRYTRAENGEVTGEIPKSISWLHQYQGMAPWL